MTILRHLSLGAEFMTAATQRFGKVRSVRGLKYGHGIRVVLEKPDGTTENRVLAPDTKVYPLPSLGPVMPRPEGFERKSSADGYEPVWLPCHCSIPSVSR